MESSPDLLEEGSRSRVGSRDQARAVLIPEGEKKRVYLEELDAWRANVDAPR